MVIIILYCVVCYLFEIGIAYAAVCYEDEIALTSILFAPIMAPIDVGELIYFLVKEK